MQEGRHQQDEVVDLGDIDQPGLEIIHDESPAPTLAQDDGIFQGPVGPVADKGVQVPEG